jgi:hypothetical protein
MKVLLPEPEGEIPINRNGQTCSCSALFHHVEYCMSRDELALGLGKKGMETHPFFCFSSPLASLSQPVYATQLSSSLRGLASI